MCRHWLTSVSSAGISAMRASRCGVVVVASRPQAARATAAGLIPFPRSVSTRTGSREGVEHELARIQRASALPSDFRVSAPSELSSRRLLRAFFGLPAGSIPSRSKAPSLTCRLAPPDDAQLLLHHLSAFFFTFSPLSPPPPKLTTSGLLRLPVRAFGQHRDAQVLQEAE